MWRAVWGVQRMHSLPCIGCILHKGRTMPLRCGRYGRRCSAETCLNLKSFPFLKSLPPARHPFEFCQWTRHLSPAAPDTASKNPSTVTPREVVTTRCHVVYSAFILSVFICSIFTRVQLCCLKGEKGNVFFLSIPSVSAFTVTFFIILFFTSKQPVNHDSNFHFHVILFLSPKASLTRPLKSNKLRTSCFKILRNNRL